MTNCQNSFSGNVVSKTTPEHIITITTALAKFIGNGLI